MLLVKKCHLFIHLFSVKISLEKRLHNFPDRKQTIFAIKNLIFQSPKNRIFPKELTHAFGQKMPFFSLFVFGQNKTRKKFNNILDTKKLFLAIKNSIFQRPKNRIFSKGVNQCSIAFLRLT